MRVESRLEHDIRQHDSIGGSLDSPLTFLLHEPEGERERRRHVVLLEGACGVDVGSNLNGVLHRESVEQGHPFCARSHRDPRPRIPLARETAGQKLARHTVVIGRARGGRDESAQHLILGCAGVGAEREELDAGVTLLYRLADGDIAG